MEPRDRLLQTREPIVGALKYVFLFLNYVPRDGSVRENFSEEAACNHTRFESKKG